MIRCPVARRLRRGEVRPAPGDRLRCGGLQGLPEAIVAPHKYDPQGQTVVIRSPGRPRAVVLETGGGRIIRIRAGLQPAVEYVEGCG